MPIFFTGLAAALAYFAAIHGPESSFRSALKTAPVVLFALAAWQMDAPVEIVIGLALSAVGDWALSRNGDRAFLAGLCAFAMAHIFYAVVFVKYYSGLDLWPLVLVMVGLGASTEFWLTPHTGKLRGPVRVYVGLISVMMIAALGLPSDLRIATIGAAVFVLSDLILSIRLFRLSEQGWVAKRASEALWIFYIAGQAMIAYTVKSF